MRLASQAVPSPISVSPQALRRGYWRLDYKNQLSHALLLCYSSSNRQLPIVAHHNTKNSPRSYSWVYVRQYCAEIDEAARNRMELIVPELAKQYGVTEQLKAENQME